MCPSRSTVRCRACSTVSVALMSYDGGVDTLPHPASLAPAPTCAVARTGTHLTGEGLSHDVTVRMSCQVDPMHNALQLSQPVPLSSKLWSNCLLCGRGDPASILDGTCSMRPEGDNRLLYTPKEHPQVRHTLGHPTPPLAHRKLYRLPSGLYLCTQGEGWALHDMT
jgi:hypothetical protein